MFPTSDQQEHPDRRNYGSIDVAIESRNIDRLLSLIEVKTVACDPPNERTLSQLFGYAHAYLCNLSRFNEKGPPCNPLPPSSSHQNPPHYVRFVWIQGLRKIRLVLAWKMRNYGRAGSWHVVERLGKGDAPASSILRSRWARGGLSGGDQQLPSSV